MSTVTQCLPREKTLVHCHLCTREKGLVQCYPLCSRGEGPCTLLHDVYQSKGFLLSNVYQRKGPLYIVTQCVPEEKGLLIVTQCSLGIKKKKTKKKKLAHCHLCTREKGLVYLYPMCSRGEVPCTLLPNVYQRKRALQIITQCVPEKGPLYIVNQCVPEKGPLYIVTQCVPEKGPLYIVTQCVPEKRAFVHCHPMCTREKGLCTLSPNVYQGKGPLYTSHLIENIKKFC